MAQVVENSSQINLSTDRLNLREWSKTREDYELMYKLESIPEVVRYQEWEPRSPEKAAHVVQVIVDSQDESPRTHIELAVFTKATESIGKQFLGRVGSNIHFDADPIKADLWFAFMPAFHGKGYATEATGALIELLRNAGVKRLDIECDPRNQGSRGLAERLGFHKVKETENAWESKGEWVGSLEYARNLD